MNALLSELTECRHWKAIGNPLPELDMSLLFYQDDIFLFEGDLGRLSKRIRVIDKCLRRAGLTLAKDKTKIVSNDHYSGVRKAKVGEDIFEISARGESIKILGLSFDFQNDSSQQAKELIARARAAAAAHKDILNSPGSWVNKTKMMRTLVESQITWTAGAVSWSSSDLHALNTLQLHVCRAAFNLRRHRDENWVDWNARTLQFVRAWLCNNGVIRWSTRALTLQHTLHGHWARRVESDGQNVRPSTPMRAINWRCLHWWRQQQTLSDTVGMRHKGRFYASNPGRQLAETHGTLWHVLAQNRDRWSCERKAYIAEWDVKWCRGRQLALRY